MSFEYPEGREEIAYSCKCGGVITLYKESNCWECNTCDFKRKPTVSQK